jgi:hypothetical protein
MRNNSFDFGRFGKRMETSPQFLIDFQKIYRVWQACRDWAWRFNNG